MDRSLTKWFKIYVLIHNIIWYHPLMHNLNRERVRHIKTVMDTLVFYYFLFTVETLWSWKINIVVYVNWNIPNFLFIQDIMTLLGDQDFSIHWILDEWNHLSIVEESERLPPFGRKYLPTTQTRNHLQCHIIYNLYILDESFCIL